MLVIIFKHSEKQTATTVLSKHGDFNGTRYSQAKANTLSKCGRSPSQLLEAGRALVNEQLGSVARCGRAQLSCR